MKELLVGTDCSGIEVPIMALQSLGVPFQHKIAAECEPDVVQTIRDNFKPELVYPDVATRDNDAAPAVNLLVAGFPCQPFSTAGLQKGFRDSRGNVFFKILDYVQTKSPDMFLLENVKGLTMIKKGRYHRAIMKALRSLSSYNVYENIMDTQMCGLPQSRPRWYIVGLRRDKDQGTFTWPAPIPCSSLDELLDERDEAMVRNLPDFYNGTAWRNVRMYMDVLSIRGIDATTITHVIDCDSSTNFTSCQRGLVPCMTKSRWAGHWVTSRGRRMNLTEMARMQGIDPRGFKYTVSDRALGEMFGNAMSKNVVERVFVQAFTAAGFCQPGELSDRWASGVAQQELKASVGHDFKDKAAKRRRVD